MLCESNLESQARRAEQKYSPNPAFSKIFVNPYERIEWIVKYSPSFTVA